MFYMSEADVYLSRQSRKLGPSELDTFVVGFGQVLEFQTFVKQKTYCSLLGLWICALFQSGRGGGGGGGQVYLHCSDMKVSILSAHCSMEFNHFHYHRFLANTLPLGGAMMGGQVAR